LTQRRWFLQWIGLLARLFSHPKKLLYVSDTLPPVQYQSVHTC